MRITAAIWASFVLLAASPVMAHHSFASEYDRTKPISVTGTVKKVDWRNPHIWFFLDVKDKAGKVTTWGFSGGPPAFLQRQGIKKDVMKLGDTIKVDGFRARDGSNNGFGGKVTFPDGKSVFTAGGADQRD